MRRTYPQFARLVERARREVLRTIGDPSLRVTALGVDTPYFAQPVWGEFYPRSRSIVIYQAPYEAMPDQERYYAQIKDVLRHEYGHAAGESHGEPWVTPDHFQQATRRTPSALADGWSVAWPR